MAKKSNKENKKSNIKKENKIWIIIAMLFSIILISLLAVMISSYALWNETKHQTTQNIISTGCFSVTLNDLNEANQTTSIGLINTYPITDDKGQNLSPYQFTITNTCDINAHYKIALSTLSNSSLGSQYIKYLFNNVNNIGTIAQLSNATPINLDTETKSIINNLNNPNYVTESYLIEEGSLIPQESKTFNLRLWMSIDSDYKMMNKGFYGVISVTSVSSN